MNMRKLTIKFHLSVVIYSLLTTINYPLPSTLYPALHRSAL